MAKKSKKNIIIVFVFLILLIGGIAGYLVLKPREGTAVTTGDFIKPLWARLECAPTDTYEGKELTSVPTSGMSILCGQNENTDSCKVKVTVDKIGFVDDKIEYTLCNNDGSNCGSILYVYLRTGLYGGGSASYDLPELNKGKKYFIKCKEDDFGVTGKICSVEKTYRPWKIYRYVGGAKFEAKASDCCMISNFNNKIPNKEQEPSCLTMTGGIGSKWVNYVDDWVYGPATNVFTYNGKEVYCSAAQIYEIATVQMKDGKIYKINPNYQKTSDTPNYINTIGSIIKSVACCPNEANCGDDFNWKPVIKKDCWSDVQCYNAGSPVPIDATHYKKYFCNNEGKCEETQPIPVQCTTNAACASGQICDLSTTNYGKCIQQGGSEYCGDGLCNKEETKVSCPKDCGTNGGGTLKEQCDQKAKDQPYMGWQYYETTEKTCGYNPLCHIGIMKPKEIITPVCEPTYIKYYIFGGIALALIGLAYMYVYKKKK